MNFDEKVLDNAWKHSGEPGAFGSAKKFWRKLNDDGYDVSLPIVQNWINKQKGYLINKPISEKPIKEGIASRHMFASVGIIACDIMYLTKFLNGASEKYMLIVVECLTGFTVVIPIRILTAKNVFNGFVRCFEKIKTPVYTVLTDNGREFLGAFQAGVEKMGLNHHFTSVYSQHKTVQAEKMIRIIRLRVSMLLHTHQNTSLLEAIYSVVNSYNLEKRPALGFLSPVQVDQTNFLAVQEHFATAKQLRDTQNLPRSYYPAKYKIGDKVYIRDNLAADKFRKIGDSRYLETPCVIEKVVDTEPLHSYELKSVFSGLKIVGLFQENRLIRATDIVNNAGSS